MKIKFYAKLSLDETEITMRLLGAVVVGPVKRGDLHHDIREKFDVVAIVDGLFHHTLALPCDEIRDALQSGVRVYGSSSMGAMRACELSTLGMVGVGEIYNMICSHRFFRDDYLAQSLVEKGGVIQADVSPFIDYYFNMKCLLREREISKEEYQDLTQMPQDLFYTERHLKNLQKQIAIRYPKRKRLLDLAHKALFEMGSQKTRDAILLCQKVIDDLQEIQEINCHLAQ